MSSAITRRSRSDSGTSPETIRCARPSTIAVLPTPGSPISTGLFFVRRESTWITRRISSSRPITGSSLPCSAACVRSVPKRSSASYFSSGDWSVTRCEPRTSARAWSRRSCVAPTLARARPATPSSPASASSRCSVETYWSESLPASRSAARSTDTSSEPGCATESALEPEPATGSCSSPCWTVARSASTSRPSLPSTGSTTPPGASAATSVARGASTSSAASRCSGVTCGLRRSSASRPAAASASWDLIVNLSACMSV